MGGEVLHDFDLRLCDYLAANVAEHLGRRTFREELQQDLPRPLFEYIAARSDDWLLLDDSELRELDLATRDLASTEGKWRSYPELHRGSLLCIPEIRLHLARETAEEWTSTSRRFSRTLERKGLFLHEGVAAVVNWIYDLRRLLAAMGATTYLPPPEGTFPTPGCPEPLALPAVTALAPSGQQDPNTLLAAIAETQREVRDLLISQRSIKDFYTTAEVAEILGKAEYTVREWARKGQVKGQKAPNDRSWLISHAELTRLRSHGPQPEDQLHR